MGDVSMFMKEVKQRFSIWYNKSHKRIGTLWTERFKSLLVENSRIALMTVAAYIDLNPVRAGLCPDPKDYRSCGYAEALGIPGVARKGIARIAEKLKENYKRQKEDCSEDRSYTNNKSIYKKMLVSDGSFFKPMSTQCHLSIEMLFFSIGIIETIASKITHQSIELFG